MQLLQLVAWGWKRPYAGITSLRTEGLSVVIAWRRGSLTRAATVIFRRGARTGLRTVASWAAFAASFRAVVAAGATSATSFGRGRPASVTVHFGARLGAHFGTRGPILPTSVAVVAGRTL